MHYKRIPVFRLLPICMLNVFLCWGALPGKTDIQTTAQGDTGCRMTFTAGDLLMDEIVLNGKQYSSVDFEGAVWFAGPGEPNIPCYSFLVAVPSSGPVSVRVSAGPAYTELHTAVVPVPQERLEEGMYVQEYEQGPVYKENRTFPGVLYTSADPGFIGSLRVVRIQVYPVQYNPVTGRLTAAGSMEIDVSWPQQQVAERAAVQGHIENAVVNSTQAPRFFAAKAPAADADRAASDGNLYKFAVSQTGMYGISGSFLENNGINVSSIDPATIKIYNNGGRELPALLSEPRPESLVEIPVMVTGSEDGTFDPQDQVVFFGRGSSGISYNAETRAYSHFINRYYEENVYWLSFNDGVQGRRLEEEQSGSGQGVRLTQFTDQQFSEQDRIPLFRGGKTWYNTELSSLYPAQTYTVYAKDPADVQDGSLRIRVKGGSGDTHYFSVRLNNALVDYFSVSGTKVLVRDISFAQSLSDGENSLRIEYSSPGEGAKAYVDWYEIAYTRELRAHEGTLIFYSPRDPGDYTYLMEGFDARPIVMDVTDPQGSLIEAYESDGLWAVQGAAGEVPRVYAAAQENSLLSPVSITQAGGFMLRNTENAADMIIVTAEEFTSQAEELANLHRQYDGMSVFVISVDQVFDEFGWGIPDPVAIRDFIAYAYARWAKQPAYLLLFGGGHFDFRTLLSGSEPNKIPPYEYSGSSLNDSRAADDFFCYVSGDDRYPDLAAGRIPAWTVEEAQIVTDKIVSYVSEPSFGRWRSLVTFLGDDEKTTSGKENEITHITSSEYVAEHVVPERFNKKKIFLTEYPEQYTTQRRLRPQARQALLDQINRGTVFVNYIGHGNKFVLTHEWVFHRDVDIPLLENSTMLPVFYGATCAFAQYDDPDDRSFAEALVTARGKGGIGSVGASRFCSSIPNEALNRVFMRLLFQDGLSLGQALQMAKPFVSYTSNNELYHLLGDPALRLAVPQYTARLASMEPDTFKALSVLNVSGQVMKEGELWEGFNGDIAVSAFDSRKAVTYKTMYGTEIPYILAGNTIFKGEGRVENGQFTAAFVIPKDISYGGESGRLFFYFTNDAVDGSGYKDDIAVGGSGTISDEQGPEIGISFSGFENFMSGDMITEDPKLICAISDDKTGINITGEIGHTIVLTIDGTEQKDLTEFFQYDEESYLSGRIIYSLQGLEKGEHTISLKAWDNANNSASTTVECTVVEGDRIYFERVLPYPNPFSTETAITFSINVEADVSVKIFTTDGRMIRRIDDVWAVPGFNIVEWDGLDSMGDIIGNGVYLYKITARAVFEQGSGENTYIGKVMKMR